ncbi:MAG TPA: ABC transporter ATP-binding protein [Burkholderiaceae bacterium]|jgi:branched-chain amino acid transport system ATP-binding protein|nr:ABC transporter ATP-binding protein [Burkholderiaceae bacterium]
MSGPLLELDRINTYYGDSHALHDVALHVDEGEVVALLGRNGAGKSTTLMTIMGVLPARSGTLRVGGQAMAQPTPEALALAGVQLVPEERRIFGGLRVEENLVLATLSCPQPLPLEEIWRIFPRLQERRRSFGRHLSGGEQQMLAIARALVRAPRLLMLDEPFEGLAPIVVKMLLEVVADLARRGQTILIVEQDLHACLRLAHRAYVLSNGQVVYEGRAEALRDDTATQHRYLSA